MDAGSILLFCDKLKNTRFGNDPLVATFCILARLLIIICLSTSFLFGRARYDSNFTQFETFQPTASEIQGQLPKPQFFGKFFWRVYEDDTGYYMQSDETRDEAIEWGRGEKGLTRYFRSGTICVPPITFGPKKACDQMGSQIS